MPVSRTPPLERALGLGLTLNLLGAWESPQVKDVFLNANLPRLMILCLSFQSRAHRRSKELSTLEVGLTLNPTDWVRSPKLPAANHSRYERPSWDSKS